VTASCLPWTVTANDGFVSMVVDTAIYPIDVVSRTCFAFTARAYIFMTPCGDHSVRVDMAPKETGGDITAIAGQLSNALLEQSLRARIAEETRAIRELIVAQAFCEGDLLDRRDVEADPAEDPRHITVRR
jgi:His-Xaa-Ser system protein HxsD